MPRQGGHLAVAPGAEQRAVRQPLDPEGHLRGELPQPPPDRASALPLAVFRRPLGPAARLPRCGRGGADQGVSPLVVRPGDAEGLAPLVGAEAAGRPTSGRRQGRSCRGDGAGALVVEDQAGVAGVPPLRAAERPGDGRVAEARDDHQAVAGVTEHAVAAPQGRGGVG